MKNNRKKSLLYVVLLSVLVIGVGGYYIIKASNSYKLENNEVVKQHLYYSLGSNATTYQEELYDELVAQLDKEPRSNTEVSALVVQNYIADYYTWTNKTRYNDISASQFINSEIQAGFYAQSLDKFYNDLGYYIEKGTQKDTLEVDSTKATSKEITFKKVVETTYSDEEGYQKVYEDINAFLVEATWTYKESTVVDTSKYQTSGYFIVVQDDDGLFSIMEAGTQWEEN